MTPLYARYGAPECLAPLVVRGMGGDGAEPGEVLECTVEFALAQHATFYFDLDDGEVFRLTSAEESMECFVAEGLVSL